MPDIILAGGGGCMRELVWQIQEQNKAKPGWNVLGFVDREDSGGACPVSVGGRDIPYLGDDGYLLSQTTPVNVAVCVADPALREKIAVRLSRNANIRFPNLILGAKVCTDVHMGRGCVVSMDARISTNVRLGDFCFLNMAAVVSHDGTLGDFVTMGPDARLAGSVSIGDGSDIGMGTRVIQGVSIGPRARTGAGCVVIRDLPGGCTAVGVPARTL